MMNNQKPMKNIKRSFKNCYDWENELLVSKNYNVKLDPKVPKGTLENKVNHTK